MANTQPQDLPARVNRFQAARQLGVDYHAINRMIATGDLKIVDIPGNVRAVILQSSVDAVLARMRGDDRRAG